MLVLSMTFIFLAGCEGQQESIQPSINVEPISTTELESEGQDLEIILKYDCFNWDEVDLTYQSFKNQSEFEDTIKDYIKKISEYTGNEDWYHIYGDNIKTFTITFRLLDNINMGTGLKAGAEANAVRHDTKNGIYTEISLNKALFENGIDCLAHELTHVICGISISKLFTEGLCDNLARKFGVEKNQYFYLKYKSINDYLIGYFEHYYENYGDEELLKEYENLKFEIMNSIGDEGMGYADMSKGKNMSTWYAFSESFVEYLIDQYGIDKFMDFYKNAKTKEDYTMLDPEGYEKIQNDWITMYNEYESELDFAEVEAEMEAIYTRLNKE